MDFYTGTFQHFVNFISETGTPARVLPRRPV